MKRVITFGEIMLRLNPEGYFRFLQADSFQASYAGSESNAAITLACLGTDVAFVSKVPGHEIGQCAVNALRRYGVDTSLIVRGGKRLGIYYVEKGASQRVSKVIYDRGGSALAKATEDDFDWDMIFDGADWFHFTGITLALGGELPQICLNACMAAKRKNITVSCDINYREKLWSRQEANTVMSDIMPYVDVCITNECQAREIFNINVDGANNEERYIDIARALTEKFGFDKVAVTVRSSISVSVNRWSAMLYSGGRAFFSPEYTVSIVDRIGAGDSFSGGLIYSLLSGYDEKKAVDFATAASCLKHSIETDYCLLTASEVEALMTGESCGNVQR